MIGNSRSIGGHIRRLIPPDSLLWYNDFVYHTISERARQPDRMPFLGFKILQ